MYGVGQGEEMNQQVASVKTNKKRAVAWLALCGFRFGEGERR
jgi:hypothetical protein